MKPRIPTILWLGALVQDFKAWRQERAALAAYPATLLQEIAGSDAIIRGATKCRWCSDEGKHKRNCVWKYARRKYDR